jgi:hypothetical protein
VGALPRLTKEELADTSRYSFIEGEVDLPEIGGSIGLKSLDLDERLALPSMFDDDGKRRPVLGVLAASFAAIVADPKLTAEEAEAFLGKLPTTAYDRVEAEFKKILGSEEERRETVKEFPPSED